MFVNAESELLDEEWHQKLHCCNRAVIRPNPLCSYCAKLDLFSLYLSLSPYPPSPSLSDRIRQKLYCRDIG